MVAEAYRDFAFYLGYAGKVCFLILPDQDQKIKRKWNKNDEDDEY